MNNSLLMIILNWNSAEDSIRCVESLLGQDAEHFSIVIVDNASADDSVKTLKEYISKKNNDSITLLENGVNSGFSGGCNVGLRYAEENNFTYIGLLNPDAVANDVWVHELLGELNDETVGAATGLLLDESGETIDSAGDFYTAWGLPAPRGREQSASHAPKSAENIFGATGGGVLYRMDALKKVGYFDEKFFMYYEDVDLSFRLQLAGYKVRYNPRAIAYHKRGASSKKVPGLAVYHTFKNLPMVFMKNVPLKLFPVIAPRFLLTYLLILGSAVLKRGSFAAIRGVFASLLLIPHSLNQRRKVQKSRTVSSAYIKSILMKEVPPDQAGLRKFRKFLNIK